ncbi:uncharacterized protein TNCV_917131 [Trichonephila clavipes]|nr:uncharacterized protein TNCV_917131 [Trichonephila clavipes]
MLTAVPWGQGSNPGEDMDICKCVVPLRHGGTLNSRRVASPLVWLVEEVGGSDHPQVSSLKIGVETSQIVLSPVWCSKLRLTTGVTLPFAMMNFVGLDLAFADQVASVTTQQRSILSLYKHKVSKSLLPNVLWGKSKKKCAVLDIFFFLPNLL